MEGMILGIKVGIRVEEIVGIKVMEGMIIE